MVVYETTNLINGKKYIGMDTHNNPNYLGSGSLILKAIKKYGKQNFKKSIIEYCKDIEELEQRETYWINFYDALNDDSYYNLADIRKRGINPFINKTKDQLKEISNKIKSESRNKKIGLSNSKPKPKGFGDKVSKSNMGKIRTESSKIQQGQKLKGRISPNKNNKWTKEQKNKLGKPIIQYDIKGNKIKEWGTTQEAKIKLNIKGITECLKGRTKTSGGFIWKYK